MNSNEFHDNQQMYTYFLSFNQIEWKTDLWLCVAVSVFYWCACVWFGLIWFCSWRNGRGKGMRRGFVFMSYWLRYQGRHYLRENCGWVSNSLKNKRKSMESIRLNGVEYEGIEISFELTEADDMKSNLSAHIAGFRMRWKDIYMRRKWNNISTHPNNRMIRWQFFLSFA